MRQSGVPGVLAGGASRVVRPRDATEIYARPKQEFRRLADRGLIWPAAHGYYVIVPPHAAGDHRWRPSIEPLALGIAVADYGPQATALDALSAARRLGAIPRALGIATVTVPKQRGALATPIGTIVFHKRDVSTLETRRISTELADGYVTTPEQTVLDLAVASEVDRVGSDVVSEALENLAAQVDWARVEDLARRQHRPGDYARARWVTAPVTGAAAVEYRPRTGFEARGLSPRAHNVDGSRFGLRS
jgi:hypothetical protein